MKSQRTLNNKNLQFEIDTLNSNTLKIKNIYCHECAIIYLNEAYLRLKKNNGRPFTISPKSICYIEKHTSIDIILDEVTKDYPYEIYNINHHLLNHVCEVMSPLFVNHHSVNVPSSAIYSFPANGFEKKIFDLLMENNIPYYRKVYTITYLLSKCSNIESLVYSLSIAKKTTLAEQLKKIIESDLSKSWCIKDFAKTLYVSESSIRKKLGEEKIKSSNLILDIRMNNAIKMILTTEKHINTISREVGYISISYFIRKFKERFGITPKQFSTKVKKTT